MSGSSIGTIVRIVAALTIVLVSLTAMLFVLDVIPRDAFKELSIKLVSVGAIALVSLISLTFVLRK